MGSSDESNNNNPYWWRALDRFGISTVILIALAAWLAPKFDILFTNHIQFTKDISKTQEGQLQILAEIKEDIKEQVKVAVDNANTNKENNRALRSIEQHQAEIEKGLKK